MRLRASGAGSSSLDGRPERLLIERDDDPPVQALGAEVARPGAADRTGGGMAFVDLGDGPEGVLNLVADAPKLVEGALVAVEVRSQARRGKGATLKRLGAAAADVGLLTARSWASRSDSR